MLDEDHPTLGLAVRADRSRTARPRERWWRDDARGSPRWL